MRNFDNLTVIIPAYNPSTVLLDVLRNLIKTGLGNIILVNDGSNCVESASVFEEAKRLFETTNVKGIILKHSVNLGQGRAYKTAFNYYLENYKDSVGVIQCDADGQHHIDDVCKCAELLLDNPHSFILGERDFNKAGIPFRSRFGNKCTSLVFNIFCSIKIKDTQTGLKGIPREAIKYLIEAKGERFEYATSVLLEVKKRRIPMKRFDIQTIYINENESSHFNPILDSIRIYSVLLKYIMTSLSAFVIDIIMFALFVSLYRNLFVNMYIIAANYTAKAISCTYSFFVNRKIVFENSGKMFTPMIRFAILCVVQASLSSFFVNQLYFALQWNETLIKIIVDSLLFIISFEVQQHWVFRQEGQEDVN